MSSEHEVTLNIPIKYSHFPVEKLIIDSTLVNDIKVRVKAPGITLLLHNLLYRRSINIRVDDAYWRNNETAFWIMNNRRKEISSAISQYMQIISILPDTVSISFTAKHAKLVPIKFIHTISFKDRFRLSEDINISPDSIFIYGDITYLKQIDHIATDLVEFNQVSRNVFKQVNLKVIDGILFSENSIDIEMVVEEYAERDINISINFFNLPLGYNIKLFPNTVTLKVSSSIENYDMYDASFFTAEVNCFNILRQEKNNIDVQITRKPSFITLHRLIPNKVEYILIKE
ncbi:MAG: hypothetical protein VX347_03050 [Bacteroidota bacterium]|nr:hypothetical protein [Bacteroidota bacterium]